MSGPLVRLQKLCVGEYSVLSHEIHGDGAEEAVIQ